MKTLKLLPIFCFAFLYTFAQPARTADNIMKEAYARANKEKKNVFINETNSTNEIPENSEEIDD